MTTEHTPTPWIYGTHLTGSENHRGFYLMSNGMTLGEIRPLDPDGEEGEANVKRICEAVNSYDSLRSRLSSLEEENRALLKVAGEYHLHLLLSSPSHPRRPDCCVTGVVLERARLRDRAKEREGKA